MINANEQSATGISRTVIKTRAIFRRKLVSARGEHACDLDSRKFVNSAAESGQLAGLIEIPVVGNGRFGKRARGNGGSSKLNYGK